MNYNDVHMRILSLFLHYGQDLVLGIQKAANCHTINHEVYYSLQGHCESMDVFVKHTNITQHQLATNTPLYFHTPLHFNKASYCFYGHFNYVYLSSCSHERGCSPFHQRKTDHKTQNMKAIFMQGVLY